MSFRSCSLLGTGRPGEDDGRGDDDDRVFIVLAFFLCFFLDDFFCFRVDGGDGDRGCGCDCGRDCGCACCEEDRDVVGTDDEEDDEAYDEAGFSSLLLVSVGDRGWLLSTNDAGCLALTARSEIEPVGMQMRPPVKSGRPVRHRAVPFMPGMKNLGRFNSLAVEFARLLPPSSDSDVCTVSGIVSSSPLPLSLLLLMVLLLLL